MKLRNLGVTTLGMFCLIAFGCSTVQKGTTAAAEATGADVPEMEYKVLQPSSIDSAWSFLDSKKTKGKKGDKKSKKGEKKKMKKRNPFARKEQKLEYASIGMEKYDTFFKTSAKVNGMTWLAAKHTERLNKVAESGVIKELISGKRVKKLAKNKSDLSFKQRKKIATYAIKGQFGQIANNVKAVSKKSVKDFKKGLYNDYPNLKHVIKWQKPIQKTFKPEELKKEAMKLAQKASALASQAPNDFTGPKAAVAPKLAKELKTVGEQVKKSGERVPKIAKSMKSALEKISKSVDNAAKQKMSKQ